MHPQSSLAYQPPSPNVFSLWIENEETAKKFGYPQWSYWEFFVAPDAPELLRMNLERFWEVNIEWGFCVEVAGGGGTGCVDEGDVLCEGGDEGVSY